MGLVDFISHPVSTISERLLEGLINNFDSPLSRAALTLFGISDNNLIIIHKIKRMIEHTEINVDHKNSSLEVSLKLAGEREDLTIFANYIKNKNEGQTIFSFQNLETSKEWLTILVNEILLGEVLFQDDLQIVTDKLLGKILNKIL